MTENTEARVRVLPSRWWRRVWYRVFPPKPRQYVPNVEPVSVGAALRSAREKLCWAQTRCTDAHRQMLQHAIDEVDRVGVFIADDWSSFNDPTWWRDD